MIIDGLEYVTTENMERFGTNHVGVRVKVIDRGSPKGVHVQLLEDAAGYNEGQDWYLKQEDLELARPEPEPEPESEAKAEPEEISYDVGDRVRVIWNGPDAYEAQPYMHGEEAEVGDFDGTWVMVHFDDEEIKEGGWWLDPSELELISKAPEPESEFRFQVGQVCVVQGYSPMEDGTVVEITVLPTKPGHYYRTVQLDNSEATNASWENGTELMFVEDQLEPSEWPREAPSELVQVKTSYPVSSFHGLRGRIVASEPNPGFALVSFEPEAVAALREQGQSLHYGHDHELKERTGWYISPEHLEPVSEGPQVGDWVTVKESYGDPRFRGLRARVHRIEGGDVLLEFTDEAVEALGREGVVLHQGSGDFEYAVGWWVESEQLELDAPVPF